MTSTPSSARAVPLGLLWGFIAGVVGLVFGYGGNFWQAADPGSVAPLTGIFMTGPIGAIAGFLYGVVCGARSVSSKLTLIGGALLTLVVGVATLLITAPEYQPQVRIVEASVTTCTPVTSVLSSRTEYWRSEVQRVTREHIVDVPADWERDVPLMVQRRPGAVVTMDVKKTSWIEQRRWKSGRVDTRLKERDYPPDTERIFMDNLACGAPLPKSRQWCVCSVRSNRYPPSDLAEYLELWVAYPVPENLTGPSLLAWATRKCPD